MYDDYDLDYTYVPEYKYDLDETYDDGCSHSRTLIHN